VTNEPSELESGAVPAWADQRLSSELAILRARGESQELEYISEFPKNVRELAKEIAAFATSNPGVILLGVADNGDLVGLPEALASEGRDSIVKRLAGLCRGAVKPSITPAAKFATEDGRVVLALLVPKGRQPVYYCHEVPYVRHLTESRPAEPNEVIDLVRAWLPTAPAEGEGELSEFLSRLASILVDVIIYGEESDERVFNPWLDLWRAQFGRDAAELRELASSDEAQRQSVSRNLSELASALDDVANFRLYLGASEELTKLTNRAVEQARGLKADLIDSHTFSDKSVHDVGKIIIVTIRKLADLVERMQSMADDGRIEEVQAEASRLGLALLQAGHYAINQLGEGLAESLGSIGRLLHLVEAMQVYMDGGRSMNLILQRIQEQHDRLGLLLPRLLSG